MKNLLEKYWNEEWSKSEGKISTSMLEILTDKQKVLDIVTQYQNSDITPNEGELQKKLKLSSTNIHKQAFIIMSCFFIGSLCFNVVYQKYIGNLESTISMHSKTINDLRQRHNKQLFDISHYKDANNKLHNINNDYLDIINEYAAQEKLKNTTDYGFVKPADESILLKLKGQYSDDELFEFITETIRINKMNLDSLEFKKYTLDDSNYWSFDNFTNDDKFKKLISYLDQIDGISVFTQYKNNEMKIKFRSF